MVISLYYDGALLKVLTVMIRNSVLKFKAKEGKLSQSIYSEKNFYIYWTMNTADVIATFRYP